MTGNTIAGIVGRIIKMGNDGGGCGVAVGVGVVAE